LRAILSAIARKRAPHHSPKSFWSSRRQRFDCIIRLRGAKGRYGRARHPNRAALRQLLKRFSKAGPPYQAPQARHLPPRPSSVEAGGLAESHQAPAGPADPVEHGLHFSDRKFSETGGEFCAEIPGDRRWSCRHRCLRTLTFRPISPRFGAMDMKSVCIGDVITFLDSRVARGLFVLKWRPRGTGRGGSRPVRCALRPAGTSPKAASLFPWLTHPPGWFLDEWIGRHLHARKPWTSTNFTVMSRQAVTDAQAYCSYASRTTSGNVASL